jgi:hypothetical protein
VNAAVDSFGDLSKKYAAPLTASSVPFRHPGAAFGPAELLGDRRQTRLAETLVAWAREA